MQAAPAPLREDPAAAEKPAAAIGAGFKDQKVKDAADIRAGRMPMTYQYAVARGQ